MSVKGSSDWQLAGFVIIAVVRFPHRNIKFCQTFVSFIDFHVFYFICELLLLLKPFCRKNISKKLLTLWSKKMWINISVFSKLCYLQKRNFINLLLNILTPNFVASFVFWGTGFSLNWSISVSETSTNLAAILKTASLQCYNHCAVIIAGWSEAPSQS